MEKERKKQLLAQFKEIKTYMGVIQIKNLQNGRVFIKAYPNLKNKWLTLRMALDEGKFMNAALQTDWIAQGEAAFEYSVLEQMTDEDITDKAYELRQLEKKWMARLEPYGQRGYHRQPPAE